MRIRRLAVLAAGLCCCTALAACSSSGGNTPVSAASTSSVAANSASPAASSSVKFTGTVNIGAILPTGTAGGNYPSALAGIRAAARAINAAGGINGNQVIINYCDENANVNDAAACTRSAAASADIALVDTTSTFAVQSVLPNLGNLPDIGPYALTSQESTCTTCYAFDSEESGLFGAIGALAKQSALASAMVVTLDVPVAHTATADTNAAIAAEGIAVKPAVFVPATTSDYSPYAEKFMESGSQAIVTLLPQQGAYALLQAIGQLGGHPKVLANDSEIRLQDLPSLGSLVNGATFVLPEPPATAASAVPGVKMWLDDLQAEAAAGDSNATTHDSVSLHAWLATRVVAEIAATIHGNIDRASFTAALKSAHNISLYGILPPWTPTAKSPAGAPTGMNNPYVFFAKAENNQFVLLNDKPWDLATKQFASLPS